MLASPKAVITQAGDLKLRLTLSDQNELSPEILLGKLQAILKEHKLSGSVMLRGTASPEDHSVNYTVSFHGNESDKVRNRVAFTSGLEAKGISHLTLDTGPAR